MAAFDEIRTQVSGALEAWDFSPAFPVTYPGLKQVVTVYEWPPDLLANMQKAIQQNLLTAEGLLVLPIVSILVYSVGTPVDGRTLGDVAPSQTGAPSGKTRYARVVEVMLLIDCWADLQLGGGKTSEKLAGQLHGCLFVNKNSLTAFRRIETKGGRLMFDEKAQLWHCQLEVTGRAVENFDQ